jgi:hypothetical protein
MLRVIIRQISTSRSCSQSSTSFANISELLAPQEQVDIYEQKSVDKLPKKYLPKKKANEVVIPVPKVTLVKKVSNVI